MGFLFFFYFVVFVECFSVVCMHSITCSLCWFSRLFLCICDTVRRRERVILSREIALCKSYYYSYSDHNYNSGRSAPMCELGWGGGGGSDTVSTFCFPGGLTVGTTARTSNCRVSASWIKQSQSHTIVQYSKVCDVSLVAEWNWQPVDNAVTDWPTSSQRAAALIEGDSAPDHNDYDFKCTGKQSHTQNLTQLSVIRRVRAGKRKQSNPDFLRFQVCFMGHTAELGKTESDQNRTRQLKPSYLHCMIVAARRWHHSLWFSTAPRSRMTVIESGS